MAAVKRINTSYTIDSTDVIITGNLTVNGIQTQIESINTVLKDRTIVLNSGEIGAGVSLDDSGLEVDRGTLTNVQLIWHEPSLVWAFTNDGSNFLGIVGSSTGLTKVIDDVAPALGANLNTNSHTISSNVGNVKFGGNIQVNNATVIPGIVANATVLYASTPGSAHSGIYVVNGAALNEELVTKTRAIGFSLIL
jgi:hypothetical protein